jgi:Na+-translocating ferredoxin:NAD+ oxidoreductase RnfG subunit
MKRLSRARWLLPAGLIAVPAFHAAYATQYMSIAEAQKAAFADAKAFREHATLDPAVATALGAPGWSPQMFEARKDDERLGWLLVDRVIGKAELITYALAIDATGAVKSIEILDYRETHGGEIRLPAWRKQFVGKTAQAPVKLDQDIRNISGATLSSRHVTDGVHRLLQLYDQSLRMAG